MKNEENVHLSLGVGFFPFHIYVQPQVDANPVLTKDAKSAILIEPTTMTIYMKRCKRSKVSSKYDENNDDDLIMESLDKGQIILDEMVTTSEHVELLVVIYLEYQEEMSVNDLLKGIAIGS